MQGDPRQGPFRGKQPLPRVAVDVTPQHHCGGGLDLGYAGRLLQHHTACLNPCGMKEPRTQLALQTYRARVDADSVITRAGSKDASTEERDTQPANTPRCPV